MNAARQSRASEFNYQLSIINYPFATENKMPKMKTNSSVKKRFSMTATGQIKTGSSGHNHFLRKKTKRANVKGRKVSYMNDNHAAQVKLMAPYGLKK